LHHKLDVPPANENYKAHEWELPHQANMTGTSGAYRPKGSILSNGHRPSASGDYEAWSPKD
jgi:NADH:ubiquinone oxidoreductase subunit